jgi:hypothetical protein
MLMAVHHVDSYLAVSAVLFAVREMASGAGSLAGAGKLTGAGLALTSARRSESIPSN